MQNKNQISLTTVVKNPLNFSQLDTLLISINIRLHALACKFWEGNQVFKKIRICWNILEG